MTKELIVAAVLGTALTAGWVCPGRLRTSYTGDRVVSKRNDKQK